MALVETRHTFAALEKIKRDLSKFVRIISTCSMILFFVYYIYLLITNLSSTIHIVVYSVLFITVVASFIIELIIGSHKKGSKKEMKLNKEKRSTASQIIKLIKIISLFY